MGRELLKRSVHFAIDDSFGSVVVVGVVPGQPPVVAIAAAALARATGGRLVFGFVDRSRIVVEEHADGSVSHVELSPDVVDDSWISRDTDIRAFLTETLEDQEVAWDFRYLAGDPERALTHLARAVGASMIVVGTRRPGAAHHMAEFLSGSVGAQLAHHQNRPVVVIPVSPVDWKAQTPWE